MPPRAHHAAALLAAALLVACPQNPTPNGDVGDGAPAAPGAIIVQPPTPPAAGALRLRTIYDFLADRGNTQWQSYNLNGRYDWPEPIFGGWPVTVTPVNAEGEATGTAVTVATLEETGPSTGRVLTLAPGRYRVEYALPANRDAAWSVTGSNVTAAGATTSTGARVVQHVTVTSGQETVGRLFLVCADTENAETMPGAATKDVAAFGGDCTPDFSAPSGPPDLAVVSNLADEGTFYVQNRSDATVLSYASDPRRGYAAEVFWASGAFNQSHPTREGIVRLVARLENVPDLAGYAGTGRVPAENPDRGIPVGAGDTSVPGDLPPGSYYLCVWLDPDGNVAESAEWNNVSCDAVDVR